MIRRAAVLLGMLSFGLAWIVGVWCDHSPLVRLQSALLALVAGAIGGAAIAVALQKIVLARLAEQWREIEAAEAERGAKPGAPATPTGRTRVATGVNGASAPAGSRNVGPANPAAAAAANRPAAMAEAAR